MNACQRRRRKGIVNVRRYRIVSLHGYANVKIYLQLVTCSLQYGQQLYRVFLNSLISSYVLLVAHARSNTLGRDQFAHIDYIVASQLYSYSYAHCVTWGLITSHSYCSYAKTVQLRYCRLICLARYVVYIAIQCLFLRYIEYQPGFIDMLYFY